MITLAARQHLSHLSSDILRCRSVYAGSFIAPLGIGPPSYVIKNSFLVVEPIKSVLHF